MITAHLQGGLGNKMFQIAAAVSQAKRMGTQYGFYDFPYSQYFSGDFKISPNPISLNRYKETTFEYTPIPKLNDIELFGYFQSEKYWQGYEKEIRRMFRSKTPDEKLNYISIHVRRGDYLELSDYHFNLGLDYYQRAVDLFPGEQFLVFSDDPHWCRQKFPAFEIYDGGLINDFFIMSRCKGHIIANSSFSWWASYLYPDKKIVAPKNWFGPKKAVLNTSDLYREEMILI